MIHNIENVQEQAESFTKQYRKLFGEKQSMEEECKALVCVSARATRACVEIETIVLASQVSYTFCALYV